MPGGAEYGALQRETAVTHIGAFVQRALDRARGHATGYGWAGHSRAGHAWAGRMPLQLALAASVFLSVLGPSSAARAADPPPDPVARLQIVIKSIWVIDD